LVTRSVEARGFRHEKADNVVYLGGTTALLSNDLGEGGRAIHREIANPGGDELEQQFMEDGKQLLDKGCLVLGAHHGRVQDTIHIDEDRVESRALTARHYPDSLWELSLEPVDKPNLLQTHGRWWWIEFELWKDEEADEDREQGKASQHEIKFRAQSAADATLWKWGNAMTRVEKSHPLDRSGRPPLTAPSPPHPPSPSTTYHSASTPQPSTLGSLLKNPVPAPTAIHNRPSALLLSGGP